MTRRVFSGLHLTIPLLALAFVTGGPVAAQDGQRPTITVVGEGTASAPPDLALISVGVNSQAVSAREAMSQNSRAMGEVIAAAKAGGVEARDVQTTQVSLSPQYSHPVPPTREAPRLVGYVASNMVTIRLRDLEEMGALLDRLVTSGANQIRNIQLTVAEPEPLYDLARAAAMHDARRKAGMLAEAAGVKIVRLFSATEDMQGGPRPMVMRMARDAAQASPVPIEAGEQEIESRVTAVFEIEPK